MRIARAAGTVCVLLLLIHAPADLNAQLKTLETEDLRLIYIDPLQTYLTPHVARCFENSIHFHRELMDYTPSEEVTMFLSDLSDRGNAGANAVPRNRVSVETSPISFAYETEAGNDRINAMMNHELVHVAALDKGAGSDLFFRKFFQGKVRAIPEHPETILYAYLAAPRWTAPNWYHEGIAVFLETWMNGGLGRAQGPYDEMVFRSKVRDGSHFYDVLGLVSEGGRIDFQAGVNYYLYGTRFMSYLAYTYSPESLIDWVARSKGDKKYYAYQFQQVYGVSLKNEWRKWIEWEQEFQQENLAAIRQYPTTPHEDLSERALGSISRAFLDPEATTLYAGFNYPGRVAHLGGISLEDGSIERIVDIKDPAIYYVTFPVYEPESKSIFYTTDHHEHRDLRVVDPETKKSRLLIKDARIGDLALDASEDSLWGVRYLNGIATLVRVPQPYERWEKVYSWPYGEVPYDLDVSPDGRLLSVSVGEIDGRHSLQVMTVESLLAGEPTSVAEVDFENTIPSNFVFSPDGRYLYGSSYYTGVSNIFRFEVATEELECVTNTEDGFFRPIPLGDDSLIVFRYTGDGFVPTRITGRPLEDVSPITFLGQQIADKHPVVRDWSVGSPADVDLDAAITRQGDYKSFKSVGLESLYPVVEGYKDYAALGMRFNFSDPLSLNNGSITATYTPNSSLPSDERLHLDLRYERYDWRAHATLNDADFYDLFGPTKRSRKGYNLGFGYKNTLIYDKPRTLDVDVEVNYFGDIDTLPRYQNVPATVDQLGDVAAKLSYRNPRASLGAVDYQKGFLGDAIVGVSYVDEDLIPYFVGTFDFGLALPLHHSSIWLRNAIGAQFGDLDDPFSNFFFGGFGNNWVDRRSIKRYREFYSFPGVELNEVPGRNFAKSMIEWNLPPLRFRHAGSPGFFFSWMRTSLFVSGVRTNLDDPEPTPLTFPADPVREVANVGTQLDFRLTVLSRLDMTLSLGYAVAYGDVDLEDLEDRDDEIMFSLKILR